jgi:alkylation response protein AidB-like acyl-CoA dehydrogenase
MSSATPIRDPNDPALDELCAQLEQLAPALERQGAWPAEQLRLCAEYGVFAWFHPTAWGGQAWTEAELLEGYLRLSAACLTTTFVLTQRSAACQRIVRSQHAAPQQRWLFELTAGSKFATVAISHLTTSRRHLGAPALAASETADGFRLQGFSAWVTGAPHADLIVVGATLADGRQILLAVPADAPGVECRPPAELVGLSASHTGEVRFSDVVAPYHWLLTGPIENVMQSDKGDGSGGLQTSALAIGHADASIRFLEHESIRRTELAGPAGELRREQSQLRADLLALAIGAGQCNKEDLRARANSLALRASQAALAAAKGAGYVIGHPAGRWCREALFFLVWSCPQPVLAANLCELAGLE